MKLKKDWFHRLGSVKEYVNKLIFLHIVETIIKRDMDGKGNKLWDQLAKRKYYNKKKLKKNNIKEVVKRCYR